MGQQKNDLTYEDFLKALQACERAEEKSSYRKIIARCGGSNGTIKKFLDRYLLELVAPGNDLPLSIEISRSISTEIRRQVAFINQGQQECFEETKHLIEEVLSVNDELRDRTISDEQTQADLRAELADLHARLAELQDASFRQQRSAADALTASQAEVVALRQDVTSLNIDKGRLAAVLENEIHLKNQLSDRLGVAENALAANQQALQAREVTEARLAAELRAADGQMAMHQTLLAEADKTLSETRRQLLESEKRCAALEALRTAPRNASQKGKNSKPPQQPTPSRGVA